jgi:hypothetical protein
MAGFTNTESSIELATQTAPRVRTPASGATVPLYWDTG